MDLLISWFQQGMSFIVPFIILLGLLIFVHELGHFLVAKYYGVRVEVFSLGFGKKIFRFVRGETEYCISIIPLGGYVKMFGDEPNADIPDESKPFSFTHKPVGHRIAIVLAGPLMNLFFAWFLFTGIAFIGEEALRPVIGDLETQSQAYQVGFRPGDVIRSAKGEAVRTWAEFLKTMQENGENQLDVTVSRHGIPDPVSISAKTVLVPNQNVLLSESHVGSIEGLGVLARSTKVGVSRIDSPAMKAGFKTGDELIVINGTQTPRWHMLSDALEKTTNDSLNIRVRRKVDGKETELDLSLNGWLGAQGDTIEAKLDFLGLEDPQMFISEVVEDKPGAQAGIKVGDKVMSINGVQLSEWKNLVETVQGYKKDSGALNIGLLRNGESVKVEVVPTTVKRMTPSGHDNETFALGVVSSMSIAPGYMTVIRTRNPIKAVKTGVVKTWHWTHTTVLGIIRLIQKKVSPRTLGGPILIGQLAQQTFKRGISYFLQLMAVISINLFILNLLPVPVLDGGHLVFFTIEAIRGAPLSMRKMEIAQQIGLVLLMSLLVFVFYNDVFRTINYSW
jgi:regulator of sigma E protease